MNWKKHLREMLKVSPYDLYEKIRDQRHGKINSLKDKVLIQNYFSNQEIYKLQIGCGDNLLDGWLNSDLKSSEKTIRLDAGQPYPFENNTFHYIFSEHLFEHLKISEQKSMLEESFRILKEGGIMRIATPSMGFLIDLYNNPNSEENREYSKWAVDRLPGLQEVRKFKIDTEFNHIYVINHFFKAWGHQTIHDFESLKNLGENAGFCKARKVSVGESEDRHLNKIERHGYVIPEKINFHETMVVEFIK